MNPALLDQIETRIEPILKEQGLELVELSAVREKGRFILRFLVDKAQGITLNECAKINRQISQVFDTENLVEGRYFLEVSSPGLDRPLKSTNDFKRYFGKAIKIILLKPINKQSVLHGVADEVNEENIVIVTKNDQKLCVPRCNIARANLEVQL